LDRFPIYNLTSIAAAFSGNGLTNKPPPYNRVGG
jgi:hypothetical protein